MDLDFDGAPARGLQRYARLVADALELRDGWCVELESPLSIYLALRGRLTKSPNRDVALLWDEENGWAAAVELDHAEDLLILCYLGNDDVLPAPRRVAGFVDRVFHELEPGRSDPPRLRTADDDDDLPKRLAAYARPADPE